VASPSSDGDPTGPPTVLEFLVINYSVCLMLLSTGSFSLVVYFIYCYYLPLHRHDFCYSLVNSLILNTFSIIFVVLLASDRLARSSKFGLSLSRV